MARTKKRASAAPGASAGRRRGHVKVMVRLTPQQVAALRAEAFRRAAAIGSGRPDASELVREAVDAWLARSAR